MNRGVAPSIVGAGMQINVVMPFATLLAADVGELVKLIVVLLFFVVPAIAQYLAKRQAAQGKPPGQANQPRPVPRNVSEQIEEFMRQAAKRQQKPDGPRKADGPRRVPSPQRAAPTQPAQPVPATVVAEVQPAPLGRQVSEHVDKYLDEEEFLRRQKQLGKEVVEVDQEIGQHMKQVFEHHVGKLQAADDDAESSPPAEPQPQLVGAALAASEDSTATAAHMFELLSSPDSLRDAIVLSEILNRPESRWQ